MPTPKLSKDAADFIKKMQDKHAKQVLLKIIELCKDPEPSDSKHLKNSPDGFRRADSGEYRIIYRVKDDALEVDVVGKRNDDEVYRKFLRRQV